MQLGDCLRPFESCARVKGYSPDSVLAEKGVAAQVEVLPWNSSILLDHPDPPTGVPAAIRSDQNLLSGSHLSRTLVATQACAGQSPGGALA